MGLILATGITLVPGAFHWQQPNGGGAVCLSTCPAHAPKVAPRLCARNWSLTGVLVASWL